MTAQQKNNVVISIVTIYRSVILGMLSVILWGVNEIYQDVKQDYKQTKQRITTVEKDVAALKIKVGIPNLVQTPHD